MSENLNKLSNLLKGSNKTVVLTGAGISTPSGIPDFRSPGTGIWEDIDPFEVISLTAFRRDPRLFYNWLHPLAVRLEKAVPNPAHTALARIEEMGLLKAILTQNIDGLHQKAGSRSVYELHGSLEEMRCPSCGRRMKSELFWEPFLLESALPRCPDCQAVLKPEIVFFEEMLPQDVWNAAEDLSNDCELFIVLGSSLEVVPANQLPLAALRNGAKLVIINRAPTPLDRFADCIINASLEEALPQLVKSLL